MRLPPAIAAAVDAGDTVIASSARGARALRRLHGEIQRERGHQAWQSPDILHWDAWLDRMWQTLLRSGAEPRLLLTSLQEQQVWVRLVIPGIEGKYLISELSVAQLAQSAYELLCTWNARDFLRGELHAGADIETFRGWARAFEQQCRTEGWLAQGLLPFALAEALRDNRLETDRRLLLTGFDRVTPAQQHILDALRENDYSVAWADATDISTAQFVPLVQAADKADEIATCAVWVQSRLAELGTEARIAVVVPDAAARRPEIDRIFRQTLAPDSTGTGESPLPFEFSLGVPLSQLPIARAALLLLRWMQHGLLQDEASWLLLSGLVCESEAETLAMARFDAKLRQQPMRQPQLDLEACLQWLDKSWKETAPLGGFRRRLIAAQRHIPANATLTFADWVLCAGRVLDAMHWPGAHRLEGEDFQVLARWSQLLDRVAELAHDESRVTWATFLSVLEQQARQTIYAPESHDAPVQILGPFESAGLTFDALWFLGADDKQWPAAARPHPFLTRSLQKRYEMPHASSEVDWKLAQQATTRLRQSAGQCVFSYAAQNAEGVCRPSSLVITDTVETRADALRWSLGNEEDLAAAHDFPATEIFLEPAIIVPWPADQDAGGAEVLRDQAACPFRAFARRRLAARAMDENDWGLDPRARGSLVHNVLDKIWARLVNRDGLMRVLSQDGLTLLVGHELDAALQQFRDDGVRRDWNTAYLAAEHARVLSILEDWLRYEGTRADFTVEAREDKRSATVGSLKLQLRVDRIDQVDGGRVIIDYKTGKVKTDSWDGARPEDPQLPIYAGFTEVQNVQGVLLGRVSDEKLEYSGRVAETSTVFSSQSTLLKPAYTEAMLQQWKADLLNLADQYLRGEAQVDPKQYPKTCQYCELPGLCRVAESARATGEAADPAEGEAD